MTALEITEQDEMRIQNFIIDENEQTVEADENDVPIESLALNFDPIIEEVESYLEKGQREASTYEITKAIAKPMNTTTTKGLEEMAFIKLFPYGMNGFDEKRETELSPLEYIQSRLLGPDARFQSNEYIFYSLARVMNDILKRSIAMSVKIVNKGDTEVMSNGKPYDPNDLGDSY